MRSIVGNHRSGMEWTRVAVLGMRYCYYLGTCCGVPKQRREEGALVLLCCRLSRGLTAACEGERWKLTWREIRIKSHRSVLKKLQSSVDFTTISKIHISKSGQMLLATIERDRFFRQRPLCK